MDYLSGFPKHLQPAVDAAIHNAEIELINARKAARGEFWGPTERRAILKWVKSIFFVFADQACQAGREDIWSGPSLRRVLDDYLYKVALTAEYKSPSSAGAGDHYQKSLASSTTAKIKESDEWAELQGKLKAVAEFRAASAPQAVSSTQPPPPPIATEKTGDTTKFLKRAAWFQERLDDREWDHNTLEQHNGPDHKTNLKILAGRRVTTKVLARLIVGLNAHRTAPKVKYSDIPKT